jgi:hypothetical protein
MYVEVGNFFYILYFIVAILVTIGFVLFLKNKNDAFKEKVITILLFSAFFLHFLKLAFYPYNTLFPESIRKITFENICAISTLVFPFFYLSKKKILLDYMIVIGIASGIAAYIYPTEALFDTFDSVYFGRKSAFSFDVIRFYYAHLVIFLAPFLIGFFKLHVFSFKRVYFLALLILGTITLIFVNEWVLLQLNWIDPNTFYDVNIRNSSFVFGLPDHYKGVGIIFDIFVPHFLKIHPVTKAPFYWPVIWFVIPIFVYTPVLSLISNIPFYTQNVIIKLKK